MSRSGEPTDFDCTYRFSFTSGGITYLVTRKYSKLNGGAVSENLQHEIYIFGFEDVLNLVVTIVTKGFLCYDEKKTVLS